MGSAEKKLRKRPTFHNEKFPTGRTLRTQNFKCTAHVCTIEIPIMRPIFMASKYLLYLS